MTAVVQALPSRSEQYIFGVIAKKKNSQKEGRFLTRQFAFSPSSEELMQRIHIEYVASPEFRSKWKGWIFGVYVTNFVFEIDENGAAILHRNEREALG